MFAESLRHKQKDYYNMKRTTLIILTMSLALAAGAQVKGAADRWPTFISMEQQPDGTKYLPAPPDTFSVAYLNDFHQYMWGKSVRNTARGQQAVFDANVSTDSVMKGFAAAFGIMVTAAETPETYRLMERVLNDAGGSVRKAKNAYRRKRPYVQYDEPTSVPAEEDALRHSGSYPSGHAARGWAAALVLAEINPDNQNAILKRGYDYGESRIITGYHYQSDVEAARTAASAVVARLHADDGFARQIAKAKKEFAKEHK